MKNVLRSLATSAVVAFAALAAFAQQPAGAAAPAAQDDKAKCVDLYNTWRENRNKGAAEQKRAYEAGKEYLSKCPSDEYVSYVQKWVPKYERAVLETNFESEMRANNIAEAFRLGRQVLAADPDNALINFRLSALGLSSKNESLNADTLSFARRALQLFEAGKADAVTPEQWKALNLGGKADAIAWLYYTIGFMTYRNTPNDAVPALIKAAQSSTPAVKNEASVYSMLASAYQKAEYKPLADEYEANCAGKDLTEECKARLDRMNLVVDRIIDAYARAVALSKDANQKAALTRQLEEFYKFRNNNQTTGLDALVAGIQSRPLLLKENQTMPTPAPTSTGTATPSGASGTGGNGATQPSPASAPSTAKPSPATNTTKPATTGAPQPAPKPSATTTTKPATATGSKVGAQSGAKSSKRP